MRVRTGEAAWTLLPTLSPVERERERERGGVRLGTGPRPVDSSPQKRSEERERERAVGRRPTTVDNLGSFFLPGLYPMPLMPRQFVMLMLPALGETSRCEHGRRDSP